MCTNIGCTCSIEIQSLNIKEWKLLELPITQTRNHLSISIEKMSKFKTPKKYSWNLHKIGGALLQCVNNHNAKFEYKGMNNLNFQITLTRHILSISEGQNVYVQHRQKLVKIFLNVHKIKGANFQCVNNHFAKFEYIWMNTVGITIYKN